MKGRRSETSPSANNLYCVECRGTRTHITVLIMGRARLVCVDCGKILVIVKLPEDDVEYGPGGRGYEKG